MKPTGTSSSSRPRLPTTRSIIDELTSVLPTFTVEPHAVREQVVDGNREIVIGIHQSPHRE